MFTMMNNARLNVGLQGVEIGERATQTAIAYATQRIQSARAGGETAAPVAIIEHPDVRRTLMRMKALTQAARALLYYAAGQVDRVQLGVEGAKARLDILTPLAKSYGSDVGCEIASLGVQIHGGMGFVEETGAAQHYRDIRIAPIYEGTNGIQAADLVGRKLTGDGGAGLAALIADMRGEVQDSALIALIDLVEGAGAYMLEASIDDRLAGSTPFLTMVSVAVCGWLLERQMRIAATHDSAFHKAKVAVAGYYLAHIVPKRLGWRHRRGLERRDFMR